MIFNLFASIPVNPKSHVRGWAMHWAECMNTTIASKETDLSLCSNLYWEHGVNFSGGLNLFGGVTDEIVDRIEQLVNFKGDLFSLDLPMPNYADQLEKRIGQATCSPRMTKGLIDAFKLRLANSKPILQSQLGFAKVAIGDSHATAFAAPRSMVLRTNGLTLHGALTKGEFIKQLSQFKKMPGKATLVAGSIDIRHHIGRQPDSGKAIEDLCERYSEMIEFIKSELAILVEVAAPVPVEYEARRLPQTGYYKDRPFYGPMASRREWTNYFIDLMGCENKVVGPPAEWYSMDGEEYAKNYMELGSSVHIAPINYRRFNWGQP
tara:strand:- start:14 stop:976 length:963 start_codon:yes stop_codon:yes gene_type:complete